MKRVAVLSREWLSAPDGILPAVYADTWRKLPHEFCVAHWSTAEDRLIYIVVLDVEHLAATLEDIFGAGTLLDVRTVGERARAAMSGINARALH